MHELSLAENVLKIIEDAAGKQGFTRVKTVWLEIGRLACVEKEAMRFCFGEAMRGSIADQSRLEIVEAEGRGQCVKCSLDFPVAALYEPCPRCGSYETRVTGGDQLRVKELEVE